MESENRILFGLTVLALLVAGGSLIFALTSRGRLQEESAKLGELRTQVAEFEDRMATLRGLEEDLTELRDQSEATARRAGMASEEVEGLLPEVQRALRDMGSRVSEQLQTQRRDLRALAETVGDIERRVGSLEEATPVVERNDSSVGVGEEEASGEGQVHIIESGDTFSGLARQYGVRLRDLEEANPGVNPNRLQIGQEIQIP